MPNNCWNQITISGDPDTLKKIEEKFTLIDSGVLNYKNYSKIFESDVTDMEGDEWGPKWFTPSIVSNEGRLIITGDSAWVPPVPLFELISDEWEVECELIYDEPGQDFAGSIIWSNGDVIDNQKYTSWEYKYLFDRHSFWEEVEYSMEVYETIEEWLETLNLDKWNKRPSLDMNKINSIWSSIKYED
jgi:hypothetical protein